MEKILVARVFSLQRQVIYQFKAKRSNYLIKGCEEICICFVLAEVLHFKLKS